MYIKHKIVWYGNSNQTGRGKNCSICADTGENSNKKGEEFGEEGGKLMCLDFSEAGILRVGRLFHKLKRKLKVSVAFSPFERISPQLRMAPQVMQERWCKTD